MEEVEHTASHKQKELQIQKDDLEFSLNAITSTCSFAQTMLKEGSQVEISMGTPPVRAPESHSCAGPGLRCLGSVR